MSDVFTALYSPLLPFSFLPTYLTYLLTYLLTSFLPSLLLFPSSPVSFYSVIPYSLHTLLSPVTPSLCRTIITPCNKKTTPPSCDNPVVCCQGRSTKSIRATTLSMRTHVHASHCVLSPIIKFIFLCNNSKYRGGQGGGRRGKER